VSHGLARMEIVMETTSIRFAEAARCLGDAARRLELTVPAFRSPPRQEGLSRSIRRRADGGATVSVALRERPWPAVLADLIDGVIAANRLEGSAAATARDGMWAALTAARALATDLRPAGPDGTYRHTGRGSDEAAAAGRHPRLVAA
jgi:hypothetical protein